ncbi:hypothetical protein [Methylophaga pinxianii]|uniref:hypothetical protein n=1 Tax=Methylophaga pinxianii TaxID=2881052 RepID=UPI001CF3C64E|nr:hypothetical protein [Methylophaga pinxianii]MCB2428144.1 hypothetical protein [Methylophaga pinxianii]UPH45466.1 hypothetical protein LGT42_013245 [Methylophaga pinxianii]
MGWVLTEKKFEMADKPGSVVDNHSSGTDVTICLKQPTREPWFNACTTEVRSSIAGVFTLVALKLRRLKNALIVPKFVPILVMLNNHFSDYTSDKVNVLRIRAI